MAYCIRCNRRCYDNHLFCKSCFYECKNRPITIKVDDDGDIELLDSDLDQSDNYSSNCIICDEEADGKLFCKSCYRKYKNEEIILSISGCENIELIETACTICGNESLGHLFCPSCHSKYKNKTILLAIDHCKKAKIIDENFHNNNSLPTLPLAKTGNAFENAKDRRTEDGHMVRSKEEALIDNMLYSAGISHAYEKPLPYTKLNGKAIIPDWFIPVLKTTKGIYIEYWGVKNKKSYDINRADKEIVYKKENIPVIHIEADETSDMQQLGQKITMQLNELAWQHYGKTHFVE